MAMLRGAVVNHQANEPAARVPSAGRFLVAAVASRNAGADDAVLRAGIVSSMLVGLLAG